MRAPQHKTGKPNQHGAVLLVMLIIMIIGGMAYLVSSLNSSTVNIARDRVTADALKQAKEALIGRAVTDTTSPGSLPCPDADGDGSADLFSGNNCPYYIGRLPWKTLGLSDLRDGSGEELWYALSANFRDYVSVNPINSDTTGNLTITGATSGSAIANNVIAIVFAPGSALSTQNQSRSSSSTATCTATGATSAENLCADNYLEGSNHSLNTATTPNTSFQTAVSSSTFNDQAIYITHDQLFAPVEMRIAREAKKCLDDYAEDATNTYHRYPWAASVTDTSYPTTYTGSSSTGTYLALFGRLSSTPDTDTAASGVPDTTMPASWPAACTTLGDSTSYFWKNLWNNLVFYQVADGYQPSSGSGSSCASCLSISGDGNSAAGSGSYRAVIIVAGQKLTGQSRSSPYAFPPNDYLSNAGSEIDPTALVNAHTSETTPATTFVTYKATNTTHQTVNDLVVCVDRYNYCK